MGLSSSTMVNASERDHFADIVNPKAVVPAGPLGGDEHEGSIPNHKQSMHAGDFGVNGDDNMGSPKGASKPIGKQATPVVIIDSRAAIVKSVDGEKLWDNFLKSAALSFALPQSEIIALLKGSLIEDAFSAGPRQESDIEEAINKYLLLIGELSGSDTSPKTFDFMAIVSSVLFLAAMPIEYKIDKLYEWITLKEDASSFDFDEFFVALSSFERGLSHAMGHKSFSEEAIKNLTADWFALADPTHSSKPGNTDGVRISSNAFFDFCSNRQHVVRRLIERLGTSKANVDDNQHIQEAVVMAEEKAMLANAPSGGDQWMASPTWIKTAEKMIPKDISHIDTLPSTLLELEWVHGYRGYDCRNNVRYLEGDSSSFTYHAAALNIAFMKGKEGGEKKQAFFNEHTDDIISHATFGTLDAEGPCLIATGEIGSKPAIHVYQWASAGHFMPLASIKGFHSAGVCQMAFAKDGKSVFTVGVDYSIAVYKTDVSRPDDIGKMICSSKGPKDRVLDCCSLLTDEKRDPNGCFISCGEKHISYWTYKNKTLVQEETKLSSYKRDFIMCATAIAGEKQCVAGTSEGHLLYLQSGELFKDVSRDKLHKKAINALYSSPDLKTLVTGGAEGKVCLIRVTGHLRSNVTLHLLNVFEVFGNSPIIEKVSKKGEKSSYRRAPPLRSVCMSQDGTKLLVGTAACEILELTSSSGELIPAGEPDAGVSKALWKTKYASAEMQAKVSEEILVTGHYKEELWGLAIRPATADQTGGQEYCTVGDDGFLRVWDLATKTQKKFLDMGPGARCCDYSPDGQYLAVGFGGGRSTRKNKHNGAVRIYRADKDPMKQVCELKEAKQWISKLKFSPDGSILAVASRDNSVYAYSVAQQFKRKSKFSKHNAGILDLDFSKDGKYLQSTCSAYELLFSEHANGAQLTNGASMLAGEQWSTFTCSLGWPVMGIWNGTMDGSDVNSVDRSPDMSMLAVGDDTGKVNVYRYPATLPDKEGAPHHEYMGHSSHVTMVRWVTAPGSDVATHLISTGGDDKCIFQWKAHADEHNQPGSKVPGSQEEGLVETSTMLDIAPSGGDEFTAVKPWLGAIHAPMAWSNPDPAKLPPFTAALGELSALHQTLRQDASSALGEDGESSMPEETSSVATGEGKRNLSDTIKVYRKVVASADEVFKRMSTSGVKNSSQPDGDELELEWVHGYRGFDCRNNVFYVDGAKGRCVVYHAASLGVMMTIGADGTHTQQYFRGHNDDITALTVYSAPSTSVETPAMHLVATGQQGKGKTFVWEASRIKTLAILETGQKTVCQIAFVKQNGGRVLVTIGEDQSVAISDWRSQTVLSKTKGDAADCYHIATAATGLGSATQFLVVGNKFVTFWSLNGRTLTSKKVRSGSKGPGAAKYVSCAQVGNSFYIGCDDGNIYVFSPEESKRGYTICDSFSACVDPSDTASSGDRGKGMGKKGNKKPSKLFVFALHATTSATYGDVLLSGCSDGTVTLFQIKGETRIALGSFNIGDMLSEGAIMAKQIYTLSFCEVRAPVIPACTSPLQCLPGAVILVGTRGCDLIEITVPSVPGKGLDFAKAGVARGVSVNYEEAGEDVTASLTLVNEGQDASQWAGVLLRGHCNNEVWGLACHPLLPEYVTVGDDMSMRCYDVTTRNMKYVVPLGAVARACTFNPDGSLLAVGFGGRFGRGKEPKGGMVRLYHGNNSHHLLNIHMNFDALCEVRDAKQWISDVKFSADSSTLCVAAHDCKIYIYDVTIEQKKSPLLPQVLSATLKLRTTFRKHAAVINHIDLSSEGRYMQSNCSAYELLFCDLTTGKQVTHSSQLKDVIWDSWTCKMGWPVQGIWQKGMDGSDINAACRSNSGHLLATADDNGKIHLFRYPVVEEGAGFLTYAGHSSHVTNVRWTAADEVLVSCGGADKCVMQWKHVMNEAAGEADVVPHDSEASSPDQNFETLGIEEISLDGPSGGDESGAVKPWLGAIRAPTAAPPINSAVPAVKMTLSWIHGYTAGNRCNVHMSSNLFYAADGQPVYPAASRGVRLNRNTNGGPYEQTFFEGHDDDILCLAVSADRRFVATGQTASHHSKGMGSICVWSATDCRLLARMDKCHQRGVYSLAFNPDGDELVSVGQDNKNTHKLWADLGGNWSRVQLTATATSDQSTIYFTHWLHKDHSLDCKLVSGGAKSINFWRLEGATLVKKQGRFGRKYKKAPLLCAANLQAKDEKSGKSSWATIAGTSAGDLYVFDEREVSSAVQKAHDGAVLCLAEGSGTEDCSFLVSGGKDKLVKVWNQALQPISNFDLSAYCIVDASVSSLDIRPDLSDEDGLSLTLLAGSYGGEIVELSSKPQAGSKSKVRSLDITSAHATTLISSHTMGELWGLAVHPTDPDMYCTVGDDSTLRIWSIKKQRQIATHQLGLGAARAVAWTQIQKSADEVEDVIAVGFGNGPNRNKGTSRKRRGRKAFAPKRVGAEEHTALCLFSVSFGKNITLTKLAAWAGTDAEVSDLKFSPPNDLGRVKLGVACHDKHLYFFNMPDPDMDPEGMDWSLCLEDYADFNKHSSTVTHFDFNLDGSKFQSNCQAGELLFGEIDGGDGDGDSSKITAKHIPRASKMAEFNGIYDPKPSEDGEDNSTSSKWLSHTCTLGWPVQGIWSPGLDTTDINSCDRDMVEQLVATGDDFGHIKIFRYPAVAEGSKYLQLEGHSSHVTSVRWNTGENLLSTGGNDNCIFVWHCEKE